MINIHVLREMKKRKKKMNKRRLISWLVIIFILSAQPVYKSNGLSKGIAERIVKAIEKVSPEKDINIDRFNHYLRKTAHFLSYMILGILLMNVLRMVGVHGGKRMAIALVVCVFYAISDEFHQLFVPGFVYIIFASLFHHL